MLKCCHTTNSSSNIIFLVGLMGCGKTFWGKAVAAKLNFFFIDIDEQIETTIGLPINQIFEQKGEPYFREIEHQILLKIIEQNNQPTIVATGGGTPCFYNAIDIMNATGITIWLHQNIAIIAKQIIDNKNQRPLVKSIANIELYNYLQATLQQRINDYNKSKYCLVSEEININNLLKIINTYV